MHNIIALDEGTDSDNIMNSVHTRIVGSVTNTPVPEPACCKRMRAPLPSPSVPPQLQHGPYNHLHACKRIHATPIGEIWVY
jgi:hypothetical protein